MKDLTTTEQSQTTTDELDDLLATYNKGLSVDEEKTEVESTENVATETTTETVVSENDWRGNPAYFQTGNKAGKLRPSMKHKAPPKTVMEISGTLIDGAMFIMLIDILFPLLITTLNNKLTKTKIELDDIQLTDKQKKDLAPIADEVVKKLSLSANPVWLMVIAMGGIYGINFMAAKQTAELKAKK